MPARSSARSVPRPNATPRACMPGPSPGPPPPAASDHGPGARSCARRAAAGLLNLMYDAMPADYVTLIATEFGVIPPTSVPVILREYRQEPTL